MSKKFKKMSDKMSVTRDYCLECSDKQKSCCCAKEFYYPMTIKEILNISSMGFKSQDFLQAIDVTDFIGDESEWYKKGAVKINGRFYMIATKETGDYCCFLKKGKGCVLGDKRIAVCRIFPFWVDDNDKMTKDADFCYLTKNFKSIKTKQVLKIMGESENSIRHYKKELSQDFVENKKMHGEIILKLLTLKSLD